MTAVTTIALAGLAVATALCLLRLVRPGTLADRIVALDTLLVVTVCAIVVWGLRTGTAAFVPVLLVASLLAFVGTVTVARYIERRGA